MISNSKSTALPWRQSESAQAPTLLLFLVTNARSLLPKIEELSSLVMTVKPSLVFVTEAWLNDCMPSSLLELPRYCSIVRRDRVGRRGGGVLVLIHDCLKFTHRTDLQHWDEDLWIEMDLLGERNGRLLFGCFYRPPSRDVDSFLRSIFSEILSFLSEISTPPVHLGYSRILITQQELCSNLCFSSFLFSNS